MDLEAIFWGYLPIIIALIEIYISIKLSIKNGTFFQWTFTVLICGLNILAIYILVRILLGAWPTYMPHFAILISTVFLGGQYSTNNYKFK
jgi:hypothetical protein